MAAARLGQEDASVTHPRKHGRSRRIVLVDRQGVVRGTFLGETAPVKRQIEELAIKLLQQ